MLFPFEVTGTITCIIVHKQDHSMKETDARQSEKTADPPDPHRGKTGDVRGAASGLTSPRTPFAAICASWRRRKTAAGPWRALPVSAAIAPIETRKSVQIDSSRRSPAPPPPEPGQVVIVDGGTTTAAMIGFTRRPQLHGGHHSLGIAVALVDHPRIEVILLGGRVFKHSVAPSAPRRWRNGADQRRSVLYG